MPKVRFKGFTDDWEQHKLKDVLSLLKDGTHASFKDAINGPYLLSAKNVKNGKILISTNDRRISTDDFNKIHKTFSLKKHDVLLTIVGSIGQTAILEDTGNFTFQRSVAYLRASEINPYFLKFLLTTYSVQQEIEKRTVISAQPGIYLNDISHLIINFPHHDEEQQKIQKLIHLIEKLTVLYQRKMELYIKLKRVLLQRLFASDDQKFPVIRFADFHDDWEQRKISEISNKTIGGGTPKTSVKEYWNGDLPWLQSSDVLLDQLENVIPNKFITNKAVENSAAKIIPPNSISVVTRVGVGKLAIIPYQYSTSQDFLIFCDLNFDLRFTIYALYKLLKRESGNQQGTSIKGITKKYLMSKSFKIATNEIEQRKIGNIMKAMYEIVALYQNDLKSLNDLKSTLLQNMFI